KRVTGELAAAGIDARRADSDAAVGGGGGPGVRLPSAPGSLPADRAPGLRPGAAVRRGGMPAVVGRIDDRRLLLDLRAVPPADDSLLTAAGLAASGCRWWRASRRAGT